MKSFFKKLAFVMAMAMVVSLAAPAAARADVALTIGDGEVSPRVPVGAVITLTEGEEKDLCFLGAPEDWRQLEWAWTSDKPEVATVDPVDGLVTAVAEGIATITFAMADYEPVTVKVVVEAEKEEKAFELVQVSDSKIEIQFPAATTLTANDVQFLITYANPYDAAKPIEFGYKLKNKTLSEDKTKMTLEIDGTFRDGQNFVVVVGGVREPITVKVGEPTDILLLAKDNDLVAEPIMDAFTNDKLSFSFKIVSNGVDVTNTYLDKVTNIVYAVDAHNDAKQDQIPATQVDRGCEVQFFEGELTAEIKVDVTFKMAENAEEVTMSSDILPISSNKYTEWDITGVYGWAILPHDYNNKNAVEWKTGKIEIPADHTDDGKTYSIALLIKDNRGVSYVTHEKATEDGKNTYIYSATSNPFQLKYALTFHPLSNSDVLMTADGRLKVYKVCTTGYYVSCVDLGAKTAEEARPNYIWAAELGVIAGKQLDSATLGNTTLDVLTKTELADTADKYAKTEITAKTQYQGVALPLNMTDFEYEIVVEEAVADAFTVGAGTGNDASKVYLYVDGEKLDGDNKTYVNVSVKVTEKETRITKTTGIVRVNVVDPEEVDGHIKYDTESRFMHNVVTKVSPKTSAVEVKEGSVDAQGVQKATIKLQYTYGGKAVKDIDPVAAGFGLATSQNDIDKVYTVEGDTYVVVRDPNGNIVPAAKVRLTSAGVEVDLTTKDNAGKLSINAVGNYTVEVVTVRYRFKGQDVSTGYTTIRSNWTSGRIAFNVSDKMTSVSYKGTKNDAKFTTLPTGDAEAFQIALKTIVKETLKFKHGNTDDWAFTEEMIDRVDAVILENQIIIKNVVFKVPGANGTHFVKEFYGLNVSVTKK